jgi:hypothetical protein
LQCTLGLPSLTQALINNAARFLGLSKDQIPNLHAM